MSHIVKIGWLGSLAALVFLPGLASAADPAWTFMKGTDNLSVDCGGAPNRYIATWTISNLGSTDVTVRSSNRLGVLPVGTVIQAHSSQNYSERLTVQAGDTITLTVTADWPGMWNNTWYSEGGSATQSVSEFARDTAAVCAATPRPELPGGTAAVPAVSAAVTSQPVAASSLPVLAQSPTPTPASTPASTSTPALSPTPSLTLTPKLASKPHSLVDAYDVSTSPYVVGLALLVAAPVALWFLVPLTRRLAAHLSRRKKRILINRD